MCPQVSCGFLRHEVDASHMRSLEWRCISVVWRLPVFWQSQDLDDFFPAGQHVVDADESVLVAPCLRFASEYPGDAIREHDTPA